MRVPLLLTGLLVAAVDQAGAMELAGRMGYLGEWEIAASVAPTAGAEAGQELSGAMTLRHTAFCGPEGPQEKRGTIRLTLGHRQRFVATVTIEGTECRYTGVLSPTRSDFLDCPGEPQVPLRLWERRS